MQIMSPEIRLTETQNTGPFDLRRPTDDVDAGCM